MKFKINNNCCEIIELSRKEIGEKYVDSDSYMYGFCDYIINKIFLNNKLCLDRKKEVLIHELAHCWTMSNGWGFNEEVSREDLCNIVSCSNYFINEIVNKYFGSDVK